MQSLSATPEDPSRVDSKAGKPHGIRRPLGLLAGLLFGLAAHGVAAQTPQKPAPTPDPAFTAWVSDLRKEALGKGITNATLDSALTGISPIERIIELDRRQPEFTQTFWRYLDLRVNEKRITRGKALLVQHAKLLKAVEQKYKVQPRFLVAFWGLESNFGDHFGGYPVVQAVATLAYDPRRSRFFRHQLMDALRILDRGDITAGKMRGSWAGAMGHLQFIPSTFVRYAVDEDGDGRRDIWNSLPDVFASAANYLSRIGWRGEETWGREVRLPDGFEVQLASLRTKKPLSEWQILGVRRMDGESLPAKDITGSIVLPQGHQGPAFIVYNNFRRILNWNRSILYAISVGHLADRLVGQGPLQSVRPASETPLSRDMIREMQELLSSHGYDVGTPDGVAGPMTRAALRAFQKATKLPADGFPTFDLLTRLRGG
jgi:peptidoglycan lytic transglycosylase B